MLAYIGGGLESQQACWRVDYLIDDHTAWVIGGRVSMRRDTTEAICGGDDASIWREILNGTKLGRLVKIVDASASAAAAHRLNHRARDWIGRHYVDGVVDLGLLARRLVKVIVIGEELLLVVIIYLIYFASCFFAIA